MKSLFTLILLFVLCLFHGQNIIDPNTCYIQGNIPLFGSPTQLTSTLGAPSSTEVIYDDMYEENVTVYKYTIKSATFNILYNKIDYFKLNSRHVTVTFNNTVIAVGDLETSLTALFPNISKTTEPGNSTFNIPSREYYRIYVGRYDENGILQPADSFFIFEIKETQNIDGTMSRKIISITHHIP